MATYYDNKVEIQRDAIVDKLLVFYSMQVKERSNKKKSQKTYIQFQNRYLLSTVALLSLCVSRAFFTTSLWQTSDTIRKQRATAISHVPPRPLLCTLC